MVLAALMMVVLIGLVGLAIDVGHQMEVYRETQNASDAAALAAVQSLYAARGSTNTGSVTCANTNQSNEFAAACEAATLLVQKNGCPNCTLQSLTYYDSNWTTISPTSSSASSVVYVQAQVSTSLPTYFLRVLGFKLSAVGTKAVAALSTTGPCQLCVLNGTAKDAFKLSGGGTATLTNIGVVVNSIDNCGLDTGGGGTLSDSGTSATIGLVENPANCDSGSTPAPTTGIAPVPDPLAWIPYPTNVGLPSGCGCTSPPSIHMSGNQTQDLQPGVYNSIDDNSKASLTLEPGTYVFTAGSGGAKGFLVNGQGNVTGNGVTLIFACPSSTAPFYQNCTSGQAGAALDMEGTGVVTLTAPTGTSSPTNPYAGLLVFYDRNNTATMKLTGQSSAITGDTYSGTIYAKSATTYLAGGSALTTSLDSYVVVDQLAITGSTPNGLTMTAQSGLNSAEIVEDGLVR